MTIRGCTTCGPGTCIGWGQIADPNRRWWQFWKRIDCPDCGGEGIVTLSSSRPKSAMGEAGIDLSELYCLKVEYEHSDVHDLVFTLRKFFETYANEELWREPIPNKRFDPHGLHEGMKLEFYPSNVVDGYRFAQEAIEKIDRFYAHRSHQTVDEIAKLREQIARLQSERKPQHATGWGGG